jgi:uncharacterized protein YjbJ (UPF0337 family)
MNKNLIQGAVDEVKGRTQRQVAEWNGDVGGQVKGTIQEVKGRVELLVGKAQDAVDHANAEARAKTPEEVLAQKHRYEEKD